MSRKRSISTLFVSTIRSSLSLLIANRGTLAYPAVLALFFCTACAVVVINSDTAVAAPYNFTLFAQNGDTISGLPNVVVTNGKPSIDDAGDVVYDGQYSGGSAIFKNHSLVVKSGDIVSGKTLIGVNRSTVSGNGSIAYLGSWSGGSGIFVNGSLVVQAGQTIAGKTVTSFGGVSLNDYGNISWVGFYSGGSAIFENNALVHAAGDIVDGRMLTSSGIYNAGTNLTDAGDLVFAAFLDGGFSNVGIFENNTLTVQNGDAIGGKTLSSIGAVSANAAQGLAFRGTYAGGTGLFSANALLINSGDVAAGKTLTNFNDVSLNSGGALAFPGFYSGGAGIFIATPVPEPSTLIIASFGGLGLWMMRRRRPPTA